MSRPQSSRSKGGKSPKGSPRKAGLRQSTPPPKSWTVADNERLLVTDAEELEAREAVSGAAWVGEWRADFLKACDIVRVTPHPKVSGQDSLRALRAKFDEAQAVMRAEEAEEATRSQEQEADSKGKGGKGAKAGKGDKGKAAKPAEFKPPPLLDVESRGWKVDLGTVAAMSITMTVAPLVSLKLWHCALTKQVIKQLAAAVEGSTLQQLFLEFNPLAADSQPSADPVEDSVWKSLLGPSSPLQYCSLKANHLNDADAIGIFRALQENKHLLVLNLWGNKVSDASADSIASTLLSNSKLVGLDLGQNHLTTVGANAVLHAFLPKLVDKDDVKALKDQKLNVRASKNNKANFVREANLTLRSLDLSSNMLDDDACKTAFAVLNPESAEAYSLRASQQEALDDTTEASSGKTSPKKGDKKPETESKGPPPEGESGRLERLDLSYNKFTAAMHAKLLESESSILQVQVDTAGSAAGPIEVQPAAGTGVTVELSHQQSSQMLANADSWLALAAARPSQVT